MKKIIRASHSNVFTFRFYFKDGNQKLIEAENIYEALSYICFDLGIQAINVRKIEEVK